MIRSFRSKRLKRYWLKRDASGLPADHLTRLDARLDFLNNAEAAADMDVPGWHFHALKGDQLGRFAVRVTGNWRLTFAFDDAAGAADDVDYEDYH